jgi:hypothetical protein
MADNVGQSSSSSSSSSSSLWVDSGRVPKCPRCTYVNSTSAIRCLMCQFILPYREAPGNGGGGGDAAAVAACTTTANTVQKKRCRTGGVDEGRDGRDGEDDEDDDGPLLSPSAPQDGVVMLWALPIVRLVQQGLSVATDKIKSATSLFDRTAGRNLALLEEKLRLAEEKLANAKEEVLAQIHQRQEEVNASVAMATEEITKLTAVKEAVGSFASVGRDFPWACSTHEGTVVCTICTGHFRLVPDLASQTFGRGGRSTFISENGGADMPTGAGRLRSVLANHQASRLHQLSLEAEAEMKEKHLLRNAMSDMEKRERAVMERLFLLIAHNTKRAKSFHEFEHALLLLDLCGADVGDSQHSRKTAAAMVTAADAVQMLQLKAFVTTPNSLTGTKPHVSPAADKMTDASHDQTQVVNIRVNYHGTPVTVMLDNTPIDGKGAPAGAAEAGGCALFNKLLESLEHIGIRMVDGPTSLYGNGGMSEQVRCSAFDNEGCYHGEDSGLVHYLHDAGDGFGDGTIICLRDPPHSIDLAKDDGQGAFAYAPDIIHKTVNDIYSLFVRSPKQFRGLCRLIDNELVDYSALKQFKELRFVKSELEALKSFLVDLPVVAKRLNELKAAAAALSDEKERYSRLARTISNFKFVSAVLTQIDIDTALATASLKTQSDSALSIDLPSIVDDLKSKLQKLTTTLGPFGLSHLADLKKGIVCAQVGGSSAALSLRLNNSPAAGQVKARLLSHQKQDVTAVLESFDRRLVVPREYRLWKDIMDFNEMPFVGPGSGPLLDSWGDGSAESLVDDRYPWMDAVDVKTQSLKVKHYVRRHHSRFWNKASKRLLVSGAGSIFEALFRGELPDIPQYLHIADDMIAARVGQSDVERVGNVIGDVKSRKRTHLQGDNYLAAVRLAFNLPFVHEFDKELLVKAWKLMRHRLCVHKNGAESSVLTRLQQRKSVPFLLHKESGLRDIDLSELAVSPQRPKPMKPKKRAQKAKQGSAKQDGGGGWSSSEEDEAGADADADAEPRGDDDCLPLDPWGCPDYLGSPKRRAAVPAGGGAVQGRGEEEEEEELEGVVEVVEVEGVGAGVGGADATGAMELFSDGDSSDENDNEADWGWEWASVSFTSTGTRVDALVFVPTDVDVERALRAQNSPAYSVVRSLPCAVNRDTVDILGRHMATTKPLVWLCDEIVTAFTFLLKMWDICKCKESPDRRRSHIFEFSFMWGIQGGSGASVYEFGDYTFRPRHGQKVPGGNIFELEWVFAPVCRHSHWVLLVANMQTKKLTCVNSMVGNNKGIIDVFFRYLVDEARRLNVPFTKEAWAIFYTDDIRYPSPKQNNGDDCGVFVLMAIWWILSEGKWWKRNVDQSEVDAFRVAIAISVLNGWFDRPYAWRVPVLVDEFDIDEILDEEEHEKVIGMLHDEEMVQLWDAFSDD